MRKLVLSIILSVATIVASAQLETPQPSPLGKIEQRVGLTDIHLTYSRPSMKDRKIFGELVPFDKLWRTGANMLPVFKFTDEVSISGNKVPAGEYSFLCIPSAGEWTLILNKNAKLGGVGNYKQEEELFRWKTKAENYPVKIETFTFNIGNIKDNKATVEMLWENTRISFDIDVFYDEKVMKNIDEIIAGPSARTLYSAAKYYHDNGKDLKKALEWINQSLAKEERYWVLNTKAKIQADLKDYKGAIATATKSSELAKTAGNDDYVKLNQDAIEKWSKMK